MLPERYVWLRYIHSIGMFFAGVVRLLFTVYVILSLFTTIFVAESRSLEAPNYRRFAYLRTRVGVRVNVIFIVFT